ncbi:PRC-barrel domain-containing protein [Methylobacterium sp. CM6246]
MDELRYALAATRLFTLGGYAALAECHIADAKLEETILQQPDLCGPANRQTVKDLQSLRDAAFTLWSYGRHADCERLMGNIRELIAGPAITGLGDNNEDTAEEQMAARDPKVRRGATEGRRDQKGAMPLVDVDEFVLGLRADQIVGAEVRNSDDRIVGEVRNVTFGSKDRRDYAIVASGGFFTPGKDSIVVPIHSLKVSREQDSFFLPVPDSKLKSIPLMPD